MVSNACYHLFQMFVSNIHQHELFEVWFFKKFLGNGSPSPIPRSLPPFFGLCPRFGLRLQFSGSSRLRLGLRPRLHGLAPHYPSDLCTPATVHAHLRSSVTLERSLSIPQDENQDNRSAWILLCFVCCLECTPSASARPWTLAEQLQN